MAWWPDLIYWGSNGPSNRQMLPGDSTVTDGSILFRMQGRDEGMGDGVNHEFNLAITDDPGFRPQEGATDDVVELLSRFHEHLITMVFPQVFTVMSTPPAGQDAGVA
jgi:hypothetical protein